MKTITVTVPEELRRQVRIAAVADDVTFQSAVADALSLWLTARQAKIP
jgi:hypothetical protein